MNVAGILRDRMIFNMTIEEWDAVMRVHLRGHFCTMRPATAHMRERKPAASSILVELGVGSRVSRTTPPRRRAF